VYKINVDIGKVTERRKGNPLSVICFWDSIEIGFAGTRPNLEKLEPAEYNPNEILDFLSAFTFKKTKKQESYFEYVRKRKPFSKKESKFLLSFPSRRYSVSERNTKLISAIFAAECYNERYKARIEKIVKSIQFISRMKYKTFEKNIEKIKNILVPDYLLYDVSLIPNHILLFHLLREKSISEFHPLIEHVIFNILKYSYDDYCLKKQIIEQTHLTSPIQLRILKEYNEYIVFEVFASE
jgi:hypothetical protein